MDNQYYLTAEAARNLALQHPRSHVKRILLFVKTRAEEGNMAAEFDCDYSEALAREVQKILNSLGYSVRVFNDVEGNIRLGISWETGAECT